MTRLTIPDIKREAQARLPEVLGALGVRHTGGRYISICNPVVKDRHPSFTIWTAGPAAGAWRDERNCGPGGDRGDVIDLVAYLNGWWTRPGKGRAEALRFLVATLGLERIDPVRLQRDRDNARRAEAAATKRWSEELEAQQAQARALFMAARWRADDDPVRTYLDFRGIDLTALPRGPRGGRRRVRIIRGLLDHRHTESNQRLPCMIAGCVHPIDWQMRAVHRTWLRPDYAGKADVTPAKKVWPRYGGLIIPLWRGDTDMSVNEAIAAGVRETLVLTEGIEDGLSAVLAAPKFRTWAFIALGNLGNVRLPECIDSVILHQQNELENRVADSAWHRGKALIEAQGRPVVEVEATRGKDLNDTLRSA